MNILILNSKKRQRHLPIDIRNLYYVIGYIWFPCQIITDSPLFHVRIWIRHIILQFSLGGFTVNKFRIAFLFALLFLTITPTALAKSFTVDDVQIRAWIQQDGDLLVNEIFTYSFDGQFDRVSRSIHQDHHDGVIAFEAYELLNPDASVGFVKQKDLRSLQVSREENTYYSSLPSKNESRKIFYYYKLDNAVKSYNTYSDITVPFFGTGSNHDTDLHNVEIDFIFPQSIDPQSYHAFFHDRKGKIVQEDPIGVRFSTPVSGMYSLTEARVLFPSTIMTGQKKMPEQISLKEAIAKEAERAQLIAQNEEKRKNLQNLVKILIPILAIGCLLLCIILPQRRLWRFRGQDEQFQADPLYLYVLHRKGKRDHYSFLAGLYSLVEKGFATIDLQKTSSRFQHEQDAPNEMLVFTLTASNNQLSISEQFLVSWLFKRKVRKGKYRLPAFFMQDIAGATKSERSNRKQLSYYHRNFKMFKKEEEDWFQSMMKEFKEKQVIGDKLIYLITPILVFAVFISILYAYQIDFMSKTSIIIYSMTAGAFLIASLIKPKNRWFVFLFFIISFFGTLMLNDVALLRSLLYFIAISLLLYMLTPKLTLSSEADLVYRNMKSFQARIKKEGIPSSVSPIELEKWSIRALLLKMKYSLRNVRQEQRANTELAAAAPLTYLMLSGEEPVRYLIKTWKWSTPPSSSSSSSGDGGYYGGDSGSSGSSSGGDSGGGAGGD